MYTAYTGSSHYCYSNSLHMCLKQAGMVNLPDAGLLECMTGMPFGTLFLQFETPLFFPSHADLNPHSGLSRALSILGWNRPSRAFAGMLVHFVLLIGARRCLDGAEFMKSVGQTQAAEWMVKKAESYGLAQYYATQEDWKITQGLFEKLAEIEDRIAGCV